MNKSNTSRKARLCPSSNHWTSPSGGWKGPNGTTFAALSGFGFDEWLSATHNQVSNLFLWMPKNVVYCIAFIQAYKKKQPGFCSSLELFIIDQNRTRLVVGTLQSCRRLSPSESHTAFNLFNGNGALATMQGHITPVPAPFYPPLVPHVPLVTIPDPEDIFNCCFQLTDLALLPNPVIANHNHKMYSILY